MKDNLALRVQVHPLGFHRAKGLPCHCVIVLAEGIVNSKTSCFVSGAKLKVQLGLNPSRDASSSSKGEALIYEGNLEGRENELRHFRSSSAFKTIVFFADEVFQEILQTFTSASWKNFTEVL